MNETKNCECDYTCQDGRVYHPDGIGYDTAWENGYDVGYDDANLRTFKCCGAAAVLGGMIAALTCKILRKN